MRAPERARVVILWAVLAALAATVPAGAQDSEPPPIDVPDPLPVHVTALEPRDVDLSWKFRSVVADENRIAALSVSSADDGAGAHNIEPDGVMLFERDGDGWQQQEFPSVDVQPEDEFGFALAIDEDLVVVGAPGSGALDAGAVWVFERSAAGVWIPTKLTTAEPDIVDFGRGAAIGPGRIVVAASGSIHVFDRTADQIWSEQVVHCSCISRDVVLDGDNIVTTSLPQELSVIRAPFGQVPEAPVQIPVVTDDEAARGDRVIGPIAVSDDRIVATSWRGNETNGFFVVDRDAASNTWERTALVDPLLRPREARSPNIEIDGDDVFVAVTSIYGNGRVEVHTPDGAGGWEGQLFRHPPSVPGGQYWSAFALSNQQLVVGTPQAQAILVFDPCDSQWSDGALPHCLLTPDGSSTAEPVQHTVSCLAGRGRVDTNIVNRQLWGPGTLGVRDGLSTAHYRVAFEGLTVRERNVASGDWWRMPVTGRADGDYQVVVERNGIPISSKIVSVRCATPTPELRGDVIEVVNGCRGEPGERNGYLLFQFLNATASSRSWVIEFDNGSVPNRSTSAGPWAQSVRAVTGRADGTYPVNISIDGVPYPTFEVTVRCDQVPQAELTTEVVCTGNGMGRVVATATNRSSLFFDLALVVAPGGFESQGTAPGDAIALESSLEPNGTTVEVRAHLDDGRFPLLERADVTIDCP